MSSGIPLGSPRPAAGSVPSLSPALPSGPPGPSPLYLVGPGWSGVFICWICWASTNTPPQPAPHSSKPRGTRGVPALSAYPTFLSIHAPFLPGRQGSASWCQSPDPAWLPLVPSRGKTSQDGASLTALPLAMVAVEHTPPRATLGNITIAITAAGIITATAYQAAATCRCRG